MDTIIPKPLIDQISAGNVILFLGAGASFDALSDLHKLVPRGQELSDLIAEKFLDETYYGQPLQVISELAISETSLREVQEFIYEIFIQFKPNSQHKLITNFRWRSIYTTNYDFLIEDSFRENISSVQQLNPIIQNTNEKEIITDPETTLPYFKLHGCLSEINNADLPLILTPDQYINHSKNRDRLFKHFLEDAKNYTIIFVGYSLADLDIRTYLNQIYTELGDNRARSYLVVPKLRDAEIRMWQSRKITPILSNLKEFMDKLVELIPDKDRNNVHFENAVSPLFSLFTPINIGIKPTDSLILSLKLDYELIGSYMISLNTNPKEFYKGYSYQWDPIIDELDVLRKDLNLILSEVFLNENHDSENQNFYLVEGFAGSGKSIFAKRLFFNAAINHNKLCFYLKEDGVLNYESVYEIYTLLKLRVFILVDNIHKSDIAIKNILEKARKDKIPLTIVGTERTNIWNTDCKALYPYLTRNFKITYLDSREIKDLLVLLELHDSLNNLKTKTQSEKERAFEETAGKELLVALYEATEGKPFETIILDEYNNISDPIAQSLYLTVCIFSRLGTYARAGLISRMHDINFEDFREKFFKPLEFIVFDERNYRINDYVYKTRHPRIAEIIFEHILLNPQNRYDEYIRIISELNIDYDSDRSLFLSITNAQNLIDTLPDAELVRNIYDLSEKYNSNEAKLLQQRAIYEFKSSGGDIYLAERFIKKANELEPKNAIILHTQAEIFLAKAKLAKNEIEAFKYLNTSKEICENIIKNFPPNIYPYHTIVKVLTFRLQLVLEKEDEDTASIERLVKEVEKFIQRGNDRFPNHDYLIEAESRFQELLNDSPNALKLLEKAFSINKSSPYLAIRLSNLYDREGIDVSKSIDTIQEALKGKPGDRDLNYQMANFLIKQNELNFDNILYYLKRSFTMGDSRYIPKFWYARYLYVTGEVKLAKEMFEELKKAKVDPKIKGMAQGYWLKDDGEVRDFQGQLKTVLATFAYIKRDIEGDMIFLSRYDEDVNFNWSEIKPSDRFTFNIAFSYYGPIAKFTNKI
ncbi:SIR2 family protein [Pedobacter sp. Leaf194]|uniref:SIR2 family protein n=1 Tax=Pedobacter sp. Leaf194 TaxID=1736297 RepID=UPI00070292E4|nr:SIR2 family protein [Pedobacter sp. Leaf194]KQS36186.1 hypothetical protein ASG14_12195 [Pedobacter sp. Leaf194]